ncbi:MAG TPA: LPS export ABC transporter periplasmic protein LptC, partial [Terriglobia bacterium]|nr:LPS export ABC transporter periplasmic protein LptC [Terriglobia bacterium]
MLTPWRVRRARAYVLAAIAAVLTGTVSSYLYRRPPPPAPDPAPVAEEVSQQTRSFSLSKTLGENTLYTITAEQVTNFENTGQALLRNVAVVIYGKDGSRRDRIASPECYYDPAASSIWIPGDVEMQFTIPQPGTMAGGADAPATAISIFTSRLSFEQSTGLASTDAPVRFVLPQGEGRSQGAAYDPGKQILTLKAGVSFQFRGDAGAASAREPVVVHAGTAHLVRETGKAVLEHSVAVARGPQRIRAARGEIALDAGRRVRQMTLAGGVAATQETTNAFLQANAESGTLLLEPNGRMRSLTLKERVSWQMARPGGGNRREGAAQEVSLLFRDADGLLERLQAWREVRMSFHRGPEAAAGGGEQSLSGGAAELFPAPGSNQLQEATITGAPRLELLPRSAGAEQHTVTGDVFRIRLNESGELSRFQASGNVRLVA